MKRATLLIFIWILLFSGCFSEKSAEATCFAMNTVMTLQFWGEDSQQALEQTTALLSELEGAWSATDDDSVLSSLNRGENPPLSYKEAALLTQAEALCQHTGGAFDPKLHTLSSLWGFYDENHRVPEPEEITLALSREQWDLGGILKGYAGQNCVELLDHLQISRAIMNLGGNIQTYGSKPDGTPWQIGIQNPNGGDPVGTLSVTGTASIVTSGDYQRYFEENGVRYHHILDPETGYPAQSGLRSVTVICTDGPTADALSTALFVMGLEKSVAFWRENGDFEAIFITEVGQIYATEGVILSGCEYEVIVR